MTLCVTHSETEQEINARLLNIKLKRQGRSQDFSKGGGGHILSNIIVMAFSPRNIVGCLLKKRLTKGVSRAPQDPPPPLATPLRG